ncbi:Tetratricopeptide repeat-containing protein [Lentzea xinjiangensis]|uniref:Tetratricopeptide repeat-containing protein n=1 Tax=Lentzea xinjiangensis TaxID=402600 RepID=A0A1H9NXL1_9PSEU|nr:CHAT domain-containing tetratricopeptide repeat protein [Lentzea xinjiangensis]SER40611.1 Tetratricopeptide repeat-containing protein [Lentzea xinjiangensis]
MTDFCAEDALVARQRNPREAVEMARAVLRTTEDRSERSTAERAIGLALREMHDFGGAARHLRRSIRIASDASLPRLAALGQMSLAWVLAYTGKHRQALKALDDAMPELTGADAVAALMQRGVVFHYLTRYDDAQRDYTAAIAGARRVGDRLVEARALNNRGLVRAYVGDMREASADFERAASLLGELGQELGVADVHWNAGIMATRGGDVPAALTLFDKAEEVYRRLDVLRPVLLVNRLELLVSVPLLDEARAAADRAITELKALQNPLGVSEALYFRARIALLDDDPDAANAFAAEARRRFRREQRPLWAAGARYLELHAAVLRGDRSRPLRLALSRVAAELDSVDWRLPALEARIDAGLVAADLGHRVRAVAELSMAAAARRRGPAGLRVRGWYAEALRRKLSGDVRGTSSALRRGIGLLDEYRVSLGAAELRASTGVQGQALALEGLRLAVASGNAARVLSWTESWRAGALRMKSASPPDDPRLEDALASLRAVAADVESAVLAGKPAGALRAKLVRAEQRVRDLTRQMSGEVAMVKPPSVPSLASALGSAALIEFVEYDGSLSAVVLAGGRASLHALGPVEGVVREIRLLRFALHRLVTLPPELPNAAVARSSAAHAAALLARRLLEPLASRVDGRPLVVVPTGALNGLPWAVVNRQVTVAPSAAVWLRARSVPDAAGEAVLAAGPRMAAAPAEIKAISAHVPGRVLVDAEATVSAVSSAMDGAALAHIAAHGSFRVDNPLFSALELADGPLTVYDIERLRRPPTRVVLSACDTGQSAVRPGDELMGFTAALLGLGTRTLIAPVVPVPTDGTAPVMVELHQKLAAGLAPAEALAAVQRAAGDDAAYAAAVGFVCFGAG